jgi:hypothetical protein
MYRSIPERPKSLKDKIQRLLGKEQEKIGVRVVGKTQRNRFGGQERRSDKN